MSWEERKQEIGIATGYAVLMFTDQFVVDDYPLSGETEKLLREELDEKLLDMRIFDEKQEYRLFRADAGSGFHARTLREEGADCFEELHYLDIDAKRSAESFAQNRIVRATGGGLYRLPLKSYNDLCVIVKNHVAYDEETGAAYISDWRLAGFREGK